MFDANLFVGQVIVITGAAGGVGQAVAQRLSGCGATLSLTSQNAGRLATIAEKLKAYSVAADLSCIRDCKHVIDATLEHFGRLDALVNCAGVWIQGDSEAATEADWDRCIDVNLKATFFLYTAAIPALKASCGSIINVGSDAGDRQCRLRNLLREQGRRDIDEQGTCTRTRAVRRTGRIRPRIPVVESAADFVETPVPLGRVFGGGADSCIRGGDIAHC